MKRKDKANLVYLIWIWCSLFINDLILWISIYCNTFDKIHLMLAVGSAVGIGITGALHVWVEAGKKGITTASNIVDSACFAMFSGILIYNVYQKVGMTGLLLMIAVMIIEGVVAMRIFLYYRKH